MTATAISPPQGWGAEARTAPAGVQVLLVDEHPVVCEGLAHVLSSQEGLTVAGYAHSVPEAMAELRRRPIDMVVMDYDLDGALDLCRSLTSLPHQLVCLGVGTGATGVRVRDLLDAGARGALHKQSSLGRIVEAVKAVASGDLYVDPRLSASLVREEETGGAPSTRLSPRELDILRHLAEGLTNAAISRALCVSTGTVKGYVSQLLHKLQASSRAEAVAVAARQGLLDQPRHRGSL